MFRFATALSAGLAGAVLLTGSQIVPPQLTPQLAALADDAETAQAFDYFALKADGGDMEALGGTVGEWIRLRLGSDENWTGGRCMTPAEMELRAGVDAARIAADAAAFEADRRTALEARTRWQAFAAELLGGREETEPPFNTVTHWVRDANAEADPRSRELLARAGKDQLYRHAYTSGGTVWGEGLSEGAMSRVHAFLAREICEIDAGNTAWLDADVATNGWYRISTHGQAASSAAWLMAQHADNRPAFQRRVLALLEPLAAARDIRPANYAYLYDRVATGENRPQRYGTQGRCVARGRWEPDTLEDPDRVEALRAEVEIGALADYQARMHRYCADFAG